MATPLPLQEPAPTLFTGALWHGVTRLVDRTSRLDDLRGHHLHLVAAARLRERGLHVPEDLASAARESTLAGLAVAHLLARIRESCSGPVLVFKGPEIAAAYPRPDLRAFVDVDVLVRDAALTERELLAAGFVHVGDERDEEDVHHRRPVAHPDIPISVEVHARPKWVEGLDRPSLDEIFEGGVPSATGVSGLSAPAPAMHAMLLTAHAWSERPLLRLGDLLDVTLVSGRGSTTESDRLASSLGLGRVWEATTSAADAAFLGCDRAWPLRTWARNLPDARERTVLESHLARVLVPFSTFPPRRALPYAGRGLARTVLPHDREGWRSKLSRSRHAFRHAHVGRSEHEEKLTARRRERP